MTTLEKNIQFLWHKRDIPSGTPVWLCLFDYHGVNIHVCYSKHPASGEYIARCLSPRFELKSDDLRKLLMFTFIHLLHCPAPIIGREHKKTIERTLRFFDTLKRKPVLMFPE